MASLLFSGLLSTTSLAANQVDVPPSMTIMINEVAWGGTSANDNHEWIELYNPGLGDKDLDGWKITSPDPFMEISLSGSIPAGGYFLLERKEIATTVASDLLFPDGVTLGDNGMRLSLFDNSSTPVLIDSANSNGGPWPAGQNFQVRCTMERVPGLATETDSAWKNNDNTYKNGMDANGNPLCGSPKSSNSTLFPTTTPTVSPSKTPTPTPSLTFTPSKTLTPTPSLTFTPSFTPSQTLTPSGSLTFTPTSTVTPQYTPHTARSLIINEIAWMGTLNLDKIPYPNDEWLELHNPTDKTIKLEGWLLRSDDSVFGVDLVGEIPAGGYFLLEKGDDQVISNIKADQVYISIVLNNSGESLRLIDPSGTIIDTANKSGTFWPAGSTITTCSMERSGSTKIDAPGAWFTSAGGTYTAKGRDANLICGSPKAKNWAYNITATPTIAASRTPTVTPTGFLPSSVVINEFVVQPREDFNNDGKVNSGDSFIELINLSSSRISLKNWRLDDQEFDSSPYVIGDVILEGNGKTVFFNKNTSIFLSSGSESVRLYKSNQTLVDVFTYTFNPEPGPSWCRFVDGYGPWTFGCVPSPTKANKLGEVVSTELETDGQAEKCEVNGLPEVIQFANCEAMRVFKFFSSAQSGFFKTTPTIIDLGNIKFILE